jgi:hypothetical protein
LRLSRAKLALNRTSAPTEPALAARQAADWQIDAANGISGMRAFAVRFRRHANKRAGNSRPAALYQVFAAARDRFFYEVVNAQLDFERTADGRVKDLVLHQNGQNTTATKQ